MIEGSDSASKMQLLNTKSGKVLDLIKNTLHEENTILVIDTTIVETANIVLGKSFNGLKLSFNNMPSMSFQEKDITFNSTNKVSICVDGKTHTLSVYKRVH